jgi:sugar phosphate isomerase/epimerase
VAAARAPLAEAGVRNRLGVCSWSLAPRSPRELAERVHACGLDAVQLALDPLRSGAWSLEETRAALEDAGVAVLSGMMATQGEDYSTLASIRRTGGVRPDEFWHQNRAAAAANARLARALGLDLVTFHAGFLPEDTGSSERLILIDRLREIADLFADEGVHIALETGQETAETLVSVLEELERPDVGVNFDPANLLLYGMGEPIAALRLLAPHVRQMHVKDARRSRVPGQWGEEVPVGGGEVDWHAFFRIVAEHPIEGDLVIEREAGASRVADIRRAHEVVRRELPHGAG